MTLRSYLGRANAYILACGIDVRSILKRVVHLPRYIHEYQAFKQALVDAGQSIAIKPSYPVLQDYTDSAGLAAGHYFHQDIWAARKVYHANPARHVDIGSRVDGFVAHVIVFRPIEVVDIRPLSSQVENLSFVQADATNLANFADNSVVSLSSLHAAEHFGLGRYGDPLDATGHLKFMSSLQRVLAPSGRLYFSVPIGRERIEFNAHRVLSPQTVMQQFAQLKLVSFAAVNDKGDFVANAQMNEFETAEFSCGLFEFTKD